jgi:hypothetical protein
MNPYCKVYKVKAQEILHSIERGICWYLRWEWQDKENTNKGNGDSGDMKEC